MRVCPRRLGKNGDVSVDDQSAVSYRVAGLEDGEALARLRWEFHVEDHHDDEGLDDLETFTERFVAFWQQADRRWTVWIAERGDRIIGNVWLFLVDKVPRLVAGPASMGYLTNVYATPRARNQGLGAELIRLATDWARDQDLELVVVWPSEQSVPLYERAGFSPSEEAFEFPISPPDQ